MFGIGLLLGLDTLVVASITAAKISTIVTAPLAQGVYLAIAYAPHRHAGMVGLCAALISSCCGITDAVRGPGYPIS